MIKTVSYKTDESNIKVILMHGKNSEKSCARFFHQLNDNYLIHNDNNGKIYN